MKMYKQHEIYETKINPYRNKININIIRNK